jgi:transcriptional regulator of acetoin/glycerol metabolism
MENLNLDHNIKLLLLKALNKYKWESEAAEALGVSKKTLWRYKNTYGIEWCYRNKKYKLK